MDRPAEETRVHTGLMRLALGVEESRAYWGNLDPAVPPGPRAIQAFEQRWFGTKSLHRVRTLLANFGARYDTFPEALEVLRRWKGMDPATRRAICHWHLQSTDPIYRKFTSEFLVDRRFMAKPAFDRDVVARWVARTWPDRWSPASVAQFASKLLSAASEAGLITPKKDPRELLNPAITDEALTYWLYFLRGVSFTGTLAQNPYLTSVGLNRQVLEQRINSLAAISYRRLLDVDEFGWAYPSLTKWAEAML